MKPAFLYVSFLALVALHRLCCRYAPSFVVSFLLFVSLSFYAHNDLRHLPLLTLSLFFNFWMTGKIRQARSGRKAWVAIGVVANLFPLLWYKYGLLAPDGMLPGRIFAEGFPLGLSFYTFQQITSLFDIQEKDAVRLRFAEHALFGSFFAQIYAGPISRYRDLSPQIRNLGRIVPLETVLAGISLMVLGLAKKHFLADPLGALIDALNAYVSSGHNPLFLEGWFTAWGYLLQLYLDFSSYSDIAIGAGLCFGLTLPVNFNSPLKASNGSEFIDRWHMSLVAWVREYLYQPTFRLFRKAPLKSADHRRILAWALATTASMTVLGAWHGNSFILLLGGLLSGVLLVLFQVVRVIYSPLASANKKTPVGHIRRRVGQVLLLMLLAAMSLTTRAKTPQIMRAFVSSFWAVRTISVPAIVTRLFPFLHDFVLSEGFLPHVGRFRLSAILLLDSVIVLFFPNTMQIFGFIKSTYSKDDEGQSETSIRWTLNVRWGIAIGALAALECLTASTQNGAFIYARF